MSLLRADLDTLPGYRRPPEPTSGVRLHMNEAASDWPAEAKRDLLARLERLSFQYYPERQPELTARLARRIGAPDGGVFLGPSSGALLDHLALAGLDEGDVVATPDPGFTLYPLLIQRHRGVQRRIPVGTRFPIEPWMAALEEPRLRQLWLTLPNNPTGAWLRPEALEPLLDAAAARSAPPLVVLDEAYAEFAPRTYRLFVDRYPNVVLVRTFSKALASAAWRLGYLVGHPDIVARLASIALPYAIPAPALEALDVAIDHAPAFRALVRETTERRGRLAAAFAAGREVAESHGNFLHVAPDPSASLGVVGIVSRALPPGDAGRVTIGSEEVVGRVAETLGLGLAAPGVVGRRRLVVLDMDGVLVDAERSFMEAVARALAKIAPEVEWSPSGEHFRAFKRVGGFNNDFRLAAGAIALWEQSGPRSLERLAAAEGRGLAELDARIDALEPAARRAVEEAYADTWRLERALVTRDELRALEPVAVLTGRNARELALAWTVLGFALPAVVDRGAHLRKPSPAGLLQLADAYHAEEVVFVGDTRDDADALRAARGVRPEIEWRFAAVSYDRDRIVADADLRAPTLRELLPALVVPGVPPLATPETLSPREAPPS